MRMSMRMSMRIRIRVRMRGRREIGLLRIMQSVFVWKINKFLS